MKNKFSIGDKVRILLGNELVGRICSDEITCQTEYSGVVTGVYLVELLQFVEVEGIAESRVVPINEKLLQKID